MVLVGVLFSVAFWALTTICAALSAVSDRFIYPAVIFLWAGFLTFVPVLIGAMYDIFRYASILGALRYPRTHCSSPQQSSGVLAFFGKKQTPSLNSRSTCLKTSVSSPNSEFCECKLRSLLDGTCNNPRGHTRSTAHGSADPIAHGCYIPRISVMRAKSCLCSAKDVSFAQIDVERCQRARS